MSLSQTMLEPTQVEPKMGVHYKEKLAMVRNSETQTYCAHP
jgi:hypothetical protein